MSGIRLVHAAIKPQHFTANACPEKCQADAGPKEEEHEGANNCTSLSGKINGIFESRYNCQEMQGGCGQVVKAETVWRQKFQAGQQVVPVGLDEGAVSRSKPRKGREAKGDETANSQTPFELGQALYLGTASVIGNAASRFARSICELSPPAAACF